MKKNISQNVARTIILMNSKTCPTDDDFYDLVISLSDLASKLQVQYSDLYNEVKKGNFLEELRTSSFVYKKVNEKGKIEIYRSLNVFSKVEYNNGILRLRKNYDMKEFQLKLGKSNQYYEIFTESVNDCEQRNMLS